MRRILLFILFGLSCFSVVLGQSSKGFENVYYQDGLESDFMGDGAISGGYIYALGSSYGYNSICGCWPYPYCVIKTDTSGNFKWFKNIAYNNGFTLPGGFGGAGSINPDTYNSSTTPNSMIIAGIYSAGWPFAQINITKIDSSCTGIFSTNFYSETGSGGDVGYGEVAKSIPGSNYILTGALEETPSSVSGFDGGYELGFDYDPKYDIFLAKLNSSGDSIWTTTIGLAYTTYFCCTTVYIDSTRTDIPLDFYYDVPSNGIYITGHTASNYNYPNGEMRTQMFIMKTDLSGNVQWVKDIYTGSGNENTSTGGGSERGAGITQVPGSTDYIVSGTYGVEGTDVGVLLVRITNTGTVVYAKEYTFGGNGAIGYRVIPLLDNNVLVSAAVWDPTSAGGGAYTDMLAMEINPANGAFVNSVQDGNPSFNNGTDQDLWWGPSVMQVSTGTYAMVGATPEPFPYTSYFGAMVIKFPRQTFAIGGGSCNSSNPTVTITDVTPGIAAVPVQVRIPAVRVRSAGTGAPVVTGQTSIPQGNTVTSNYSSLLTTTQNCVYALPIKLIDFTVEYNSSTDCSDLNWSTETEINNHYFFIQRSTDGQNWQTIDTVAGAGNSDQTRYYTAIDHHPPVGIDYYRLIQEDYDGNRQSFNVVTINIIATKTITLFPNPASTVVTIEGENLQAASIYNALGQNIWNGNAADSKLTIDISSFADGLYIVQAIDKVGNTTMLKFTKQAHG